MRIETREITVGENEAGLRVDAFLAQRFVKFSRNEWQKRIQDNAITLNGHIARASRKLRAGDVLTFSYSMRDEPVVDTAISVLFEDDNYLVINKPPGLPVHPSGIYRTRTVTTALADTGVLREPYLLHRLDRETSGVLGLAKTRIAAAAFQRVLRAGLIEKDYLVAVEGHFATELDASGFIYRLPGSRLPRQRHYKGEGPPTEAIEVQACRTYFKPIRFQAGLTLIEARLYTGRMHQIRATLKSLGYPVVGDKLYGVDENLYFRFADGEMTEAEWALLRIDRSALHCYTLTLPHPLSKEPWRLKAPLPGDIRWLFE